MHICFPIFLLNPYFLYELSQMLEFQSFSRYRLGFNNYFLILSTECSVSIYNTYFPRPVLLFIKIIIVYTSDFDYIYCYIYILLYILLYIIKASDNAQNFKPSFSSRRNWICIKKGVYSFT